MNENQRIKKITELTSEEIASICDHTFLRRVDAYLESAKSGENPIEVRKKAFQDFLEQTVTSKLIPYAVCVRCEDVRTAVNYLILNGRKEVKVAAVVGFPEGSMYATDAKVAETRLALGYGATEIDMVLNCDKLKENDLMAVESDIAAILYTVREKPEALLKVILEISELNFAQIRDASILCGSLGVDFIKTSTGYSDGGANGCALRTMRENFRRGIKMSGGVSEKNHHLYSLLEAVSGRTDGMIELNPMLVRIGESSLFGKLQN